MQKPLLPLVGILALGTSALVFFSLAPADRTRDPAAAAEFPPTASGPLSNLRDDRSDRASRISFAPPGSARGEEERRSPIAAGPGLTTAAGEKMGGSLPGVKLSRKRERASTRQSDSVGRIRTPSPALAKALAERLSAEPSPALRGGPVTLQMGQMVIELAPGLQAPAALAAHDPELGFAPQHEALKAQIADRFAGEVEPTLSSPATEPEAIGKAWISAQERADARYRGMFGDAAFLKQKAAIARETFGW
jgi:hypothetical protein